MNRLLLVFITIAILSAPALSSTEAAPNMGMSVQACECSLHTNNGCNAVNGSCCSIQPFSENESGLNLLPAGDDVFVMAETVLQLYAPSNTENSRFHIHQLPFDPPLQHIRLLC
jgi:hypothetical protein